MDSEFCCSESCKHSRTLLLLAWQTCQFLPTSFYRCGRIVPWPLPAVLLAIRSTDNSDVLVPASGEFLAQEAQAWGRSMEASLHLCSDHELVAELLQIPINQPIAVPEVPEPLGSASVVAMI